MAAALALFAALMFALGTVMQQREAMKVSDEDAHSAGLLIASPSARRGWEGSSPTRSGSSLRRRRWASAA